MKTTTYEIEVKWYRYNTGYAENGYFIKHLKFSEIKETEKMFQKINKYLNGKPNDQEIDNLNEELFGGDGRLVDLIGIYKILTTKKKIKL